MNRPRDEEHGMDYVRARAMRRRTLAIFGALVLVFGFRLVSGTLRRYPVRLEGQVFHYSDPRPEDTGKFRVDKSSFADTRLAPLAGAKVTLVFGDRFDFAPTTFTDGSGRFQVTATAAQGRIDGIVIVEKESFQTAYTTVDDIRKSSGKRVDAVMVPESSSHEQPQETDLEPSRSKLD